MSGESTTPDLVERMRSLGEAANVGDFDAMLGFFAPDAVWEGTLESTLEGVAAIRGFWEDWYASYAEFCVEQEEVLDLGNGVVFAVFVQKARLAGSSGEVGLRYAAVIVWVEGVIVRVTNYTYPDEGRAAAERLAEERG